MLGAVEVGMLQAVLERGFRPDLIVGSSVGALNGVVVAADPRPAAAERLRDLWGRLGDRDIFTGSVLGQLSTLARHRTHLHSNMALRMLIDESVPGGRFEHLPVAFQCVAASIERAGAHWFDRGPITDPVLASCAVPGLLPPVEIDGEHYFDGGLVQSVPVGRAVEMGATLIFVLHVGRIEQPLVPPRWPWEVAVVAFEISRRHQLTEDLGRVPPGVEVHVLPTGGSRTPAVSVRHRRGRDVAGRTEAAYLATGAYLDTHLDG
jgi:NTE family protein